MVKRPMQQEDVTILNIYAPTAGAPRFIKQVLRDLQRDVDSHMIIVGEFNTLLSILDTSMKQKINKDIQELNSILEQGGLIASIEPSTPNQQKIHSSQHHITPIIKLTT